MKIIYSGLESSGKSLKLAMTAVDLLYRNAKWNKETGKSRPIVSNLFFTPLFDSLAKEQGVELKYWSSLDELVEFENCDVIIDEVGNYFDARKWSDLSLEVREWITQSAKRGIEIYGSAQDFAQVDKAFRRLVGSGASGGLYEIQKVIGSPRPAATRPPVKKIWGICVMRELDARSYSEDKKKFAGSALSLPKIFYIRRKYCEIFDTTQRIRKGLRPPLKHEVLRCDTCHMTKVVHF
jgi:hypothetical protein